MHRLNRTLLLLPLLLTLSVQGLIAFGMVALPVLLPAYAAALGVGAAFGGAAMAMAYTGATATAFLLSSRVRGFGAVRTCQAAMLTAGAGLALAAAGSQTALLAGALALGLGYGPVTAASATLLTRVAPPHSYGLVFSVNRISIPLGAAVAGALLPALADWIGWRGALSVIAASCGLVAVLLQAARHLDAGGSGVGMHTAVPVRLLEPLRLLLLHPKRRALTQASLAFLAAQSCLSAFTVTFLVGELQQSHLKAGATLAGAQFAGVVARLVMGVVSDRSSRRTLCIGLIGLATGLAALASPGWADHAVFALFLLYGAAALGWNGVLLAEMAQTTTQERAGEVTGASSAVAFAGAVAGPALFSALLAFTGYAGAFLLLSLAVLACSVALIRFDLRKPAASDA